MKVKCDYCGTYITVDSSYVCPNCGAYLDISDELRERKEQLEQKQREMMEIKRRNEEERKQNREQNRQQPPFSGNPSANKSGRSALPVRLGCLIPVIILAILILFNVVVRFSLMNSVDRFLTGNDTFDEFWIDEATLPSETEPVMKAVTVGIGEKAETARYTVLCDEIREIDPYPWSPNKGYRYVAVHLILTNNLDDTQQLLKNMDCVVDGIAQDSHYMSGYKDISGNWISPGLSIDGYKIFEIPIDGEKIRILYGEYVTITAACSEILPLETE